MLTFLMVAFQVECVLAALVLALVIGGLAQRRYGSPERCGDYERALRAAKFSNGLLEEVVMAGWIGIKVFERGSKNDHSAFVENFKRGYEENRIKKSAIARGDAIFVMILCGEMFVGYVFWMLFI